MARSSQYHCVLGVFLHEIGYQMKTRDSSYLTVQAVSSSQKLLTKPNCYAGHREIPLKLANRSWERRDYHGT